MLRDSYERMIIKESTYGTVIRSNLFPQVHIRVGTSCLLASLSPVHSHAPSFVCTAAPRIRDPEWNRAHKGLLFLTIPTHWAKPSIGT